MKNYESCRNQHGANRVVLKTDSRIDKQSKIEDKIESTRKNLKN